MMTMSDVRLNRWTRGSHDRLCVRAEGTDRGYVDLKTGQPRPKNGLAWPDHIGVEVARWLRNNGYTAQAARWPTTLTQHPAASTAAHPRSRRRPAGTGVSENTEPPLPRMSNPIAPKAPQLGRFG
jgi:hypothetical protein